MSERFWARIEIGGDLHKQDLKKFCEAVEVSEEMTLLDRMEDGFVVVDEEQVAYGRFTDLENLCQEIGLSYIRQSDGMYEYSPEYEFWQPEMPEPDYIILDHSGNEMVCMSRVRNIRDVFAAGNLERVQTLLDEAIVDLPELPKFQMIDQKTKEKEKEQTA